MEQKSIEMQSDVNTVEKTAPENENIPITFRFFSTLRNSAGTGEITLEIKKGETLKKVLVEMEEKFLKPKNAAILNEGKDKLEIGVICLINDVDMKLAGGLQKKLNKACTITLISSLHGG